MVAMAIDDEIFELVHATVDDDMVLGDWTDEWSDESEDDGTEPLTCIQSAEDIVMDFDELPSMFLLGYNEHGYMLPDLAPSSASSMSSSSEESMDDGMTGTFLDRLQATSQKLRESMKKSQETRKSLFFKTERTALFADRVEKVVQSVKESTDKLQTLLETKDS